MNILIRYLGYIVLISAGFRVLPITAGIIYGESVVLFLISTAISLLLGFVLIRLGKRKDSKQNTLDHLNLPQAFMLVGHTFIILPLIGAISYLPSFNYNVLNAIFESVSGFTTTGLTMYGSLEGLPKSLLLWRAETQWIGGIGIVIVFLFIISRLHFRAKQETTQIETTSSLYKTQGFSQKLEPSLRKSSKNVLVIYGCYTLLGAILLYISGMSVFESVSLSFTSISTGGFLVTDTLQTTGVQLVILGVMMFLGSISFIAHNKILQRKFKEFILLPEKNIFLIFVGVSAILVFTIQSDMKIVLFQLVSAFTTTGYSISEISVLPHLFIMITICGMLVGGSIGSTSGGLKVYRVYALFSMIPWMLRKLVSPRHALIPLKIKDEVVEEKELFIIMVFVSLFFLILLSGTVIFLLLGYNFLDSIFQIASALGTVGLQTIDLVAVPFAGKLILILAMLLGRLEIFPIIILFKTLFKN